MHLARSSHPIKCTVTAIPPQFLSELLNTAEQIVNYVESRLSDSPQPTAIVVQAAGKLKHREVGRILKAIGQAQSDIENIHLAVLDQG